jgi:hypothetical protein
VKACSWDCDTTKIYHICSSILWVFTLKENHIMYMCVQPRNPDMLVSPLWIGKMVCTETTMTGCFCLPRPSSPWIAMGITRDQFTDSSWKIGSRFSTFWKFCQKCSSFPRIHLSGSCSYHPRRNARHIQRCISPNLKSARQGISPMLVQVFFLNVGSIDVHG